MLAEKVLRSQQTTPVKPRARKGKIAAEEAVAEDADSLPLLGKFQSGLYPFAS